MDIVVDTSAPIAVIANEPEKPTLVELTSGADLIAPVSVHFDIEGIDLGITTEEIVQFIAESRRYSA